MVIEVFDVCRGDAKIFCRIAVKECLPESRVDVQVESDRGSVPSYVFEEDGVAALDAPSSKRDFVLVFPITALKVRIVVQELSLGGEVLNVAESELPPLRAKWLSRLNGVRRSREVSSIRNCDALRTLNRVAITFRDCAVIGDFGGEGRVEEESVFHGTAHVPCCLASSDFALSCKRLNLEEASAEFIVSRTKRIESSSDKTAPLWETQFSMRVQASLEDLIVCVTDSGTGTVVGFEALERQQVRCLKEQTMFSRTPADRDPRYHDWFLSRKASPSILEVQRKAAVEAGPKFSVIVLNRDGQGDLLRSSIASVMAQTYAQWEIVLVDASGTHGAVSAVRDIVPDASSLMSFEVDAAGVSSSVKKAFDQASGDYVAFIESGDLLEPDLLFEYARVIRGYEPDLVYCDEDVVTQEGSFARPFFKPDLSIDLERAVDYIHRVVALKTDVALLLQAGDERIDAAYDYDYVLKAIEKAQAVHHIQKVLVHCQETSSDLQERVSEARLVALEGHLARVGLDANISAVSRRTFRVDYRIEGSPLVSIVVPSKDEADVLERCVRSIINTSTYQNYELIIVENNSEEPETIVRYSEICALDERVKLVRWHGRGFNYSSIMNFGVAHSNGEYLLLLNNDIEVVTPQWIESMLGYCQRADVGAVGARLVYPDGIIQHAGVILAGGRAMHMGQYVPGGDGGYQGLLSLPRNFSAVTAACLMMRRSTFNAVGGFDARYEVEYGDVDFCLRIRALGKSVVYTPYAELIHYESLSRGRAATKSSQARSFRELSMMRATWAELFVTGDPFFNSQLYQGDPESGCCLLLK